MDIVIEFSSFLDSIQAILENLPFFEIVPITVIKSAASVTNRLNVNKVITYSES